MANQQLATTTAGQFNQFLQKHKGQLEAALPKHLNADRIVRIALTEFSKNPKLQQCTQTSIFSSLIIAGQLGLEPGVNGQGYLIPYDKKEKQGRDWVVKETICQFIPGWKGLVDLVSRSGRATVWTGAVYEGDDFDYMLGAEPYCRHRPMGEFDPAKMTHVYAIGKVNGAEMPVIEVWTIKRVRAHFAKTVVKGLQEKHYSHNHFEMYARKVVLLQVLKYMPQSIELSNAVMASDAAEMGQNVTIDGNFVVVDDQQPNYDEQTVMPEAPAQYEQPHVEQQNFAQPAPVQQPPVQQPPVQQAPIQQQVQQSYQDMPQSHAVSHDDMFGGME